MMRVLFVQKDFFPHYGLLSLASVARKAGHACNLVITDIEPLDDILTGFRPDAVAITFTSGQAEWARRTARVFKQRLGSAISVIAGGAHPTFFPEIVKEDCFDVVCRGEADLSFPRLLEAVETRSSFTGISNLVYSEGGELRHTRIEIPRKLETLPFPAYDLMRKYEVYERLGYLNTRTSRGCPYHCSFCYAPAYRNLLDIEEGFFRRRIPKAIVAEIAYARKLFPSISFIKFDDDTFNLPPLSWLEEFSPLYRQHVGLPFDCYIRIDLMTERNAHLLKEAGCKAVKFGVESGDDAIRNGVFRKGLSRKTIHSGVALLKKQGIITITSNIIGAPNETLEQALSTYEFNINLGVDAADCSNLHIYPGTPLAQDFEELEYRGEYFYFTGSQSKISREFRNLVSLFPLSIMMRVPPKVLQRIIGLPTNPLFRIALWTGQALIKVRMKEQQLATLVRLHVFAKGFFGLSPPNGGAAATQVAGSSGRLQNACSIQVGSEASDYNSFNNHTK